MGEGAQAAPHPRSACVLAQSPGDAGTARTGKSGHRGRGSAGTRDGSASGGDSKEGGLLWQRPLRGWPATWTKGREARSASAPLLRRLRCLNLRLSSTRSPRPESTTSRPPCAPALASVGPASPPGGGDEGLPAPRSAGEALAGSEEKLGGAREREDGGRGPGRRGATAPRLTPASSSSSSCRCPCRASSRRSWQAPGPRRCRRRRRRRRGLPVPPSRPRRKWTASPGNRCARR